MTSFAKKIVNNILAPLAIEICRKTDGSTSALPYDFSDVERGIFEQVKHCTMTSPERIAVLVEAVRHVVRGDIGGDIVECGVWKGGSAMAALLALKSLDCHERDVWLYDTFEGMSNPTSEDVSFDGETAEDQLKAQDIESSKSIWCYSPIEEVKANVGTIGYPKQKIHFIKGRVESNLPEHAPAQIALLRLDTDWYESTRHELIHLYPRLASGGILIVDDYGYWKGSKKAVDEYFEESGARPLLTRIDSTARIAIKP